MSIERANKLAAATIAKATKPTVALGCVARFPRAMTEIAKVSAFGSKKHNVPMGSMAYLDMAGAANAFREAELRHVVAEIIEGPINREDGDLLHKAQKAWNALADLEVYLYQGEKDDG
jgi:uncharacterized protein YecT (DUF1311 family)